MDIASVASAQSPQLNSNTPAREAKDQSTVSASDFLSLLITQLTNQDPLNPMEDKEFMAQMAQFSSLEEMSQLNSTMTNFVQQQQAQSTSAYLGREVTILSDNGVRVEGLVTAVNSNNAEGKVTVTVDGNDYDVNKVQSVRMPESDTGLF